MLPAEKLPRPFRPNGLLYRGWRAIDQCSLPPAAKDVVRQSMLAIYDLSPEDEDAILLCVLLGTNHEVRNFVQSLPRRVRKMGLEARIQPNESVGAWAGRISAGELIFQFVWKILSMHVALLSLNDEEYLPHFSPTDATLFLDVQKGRNNSCLVPA